MLELRPNCERCDVDLPPAADARICTYECTFCPDCAENHLMNVCPNCGGGLVPGNGRPPRTARAPAWSTTHRAPVAGRWAIPSRRLPTWCRVSGPSTLRSLKFAYPEGREVMEDGMRKPLTRLTEPLVRENGVLRPATWDEALDRAADGFRDAVAAARPERVRPVQLLEGDERGELHGAEVRPRRHRLEQHRQLQPNLTRS